MVPLGMELVREDGGLIELKEGERHEVGRGSAGFDDAQSLDKSVSRLHVIVELLRPASRKGKEVVGKSTALKLHLHVVGRNPICIIASQGEAGDRNSSRVKFAGKGEIDWLAPGDKFALSIRRPLFFVLRQCSPGSLVGDEMPIESQRAERNTTPVENNLMSPVENSVKELESNSLEEEEEEGIARAVARRQRRKLEREAEQQRMRLSEQRHSQNVGELEEDSDRVKLDANSHEKEESVVTRQSDHDVYPLDPVSVFGFVVKGSEFQAYEKRSKTEKGLAWNWKIDKRGETEDDSFEDNALDGKSKTNIRNLVKKSRLEEEDEEWGGDNKEEEERISKAIGPKAKSKVSTRSSRSNSSDQNRKSPQTLNTQLSNRSGRVSKDGEDLSGFIVDDNDSIEDDEDEDEEEDEWMDTDEVAPHQAGNRPTNGQKAKPACKYGSNCYRKNKEHLANFSHPHR